MTVDSALHIYLPLILERPVLAIIFLSFLLIVSVALMSLITAVIVDRAIRSTNEERSQSTRAYSSSSRYRNRAFGC